MIGDNQRVYEHSKRCVMLSGSRQSNVTPVKLAHRPTSSLDLGYSIAMSQSDFARSVINGCI